MDAKTLQEDPASLIGCIVDGARGVYMGEAIQDLASDLGWEGERADSTDGESYHEATQEAEDFLNSLAPENYMFVMSESGDFLFVEIHEWCGGD